jgi:ABC-type transport system substrate-binding protein
MRRRRAACTGFCLLLLALSLAGCTAGRRSGAASATPISTHGTLRCPLPAEPSTLDPAKTPDLITSEMLSHCFEGLVRYNEQNQIEPCLAERWEVSPDGRTYTFHLRKGVTFQNGRPFAAADVKYSWERALAPKTASTVAANYLSGILGVKEVVAGRRKDLAGVQVVDGRTLRVTLDRPRSYFLGMLSYPTGDVVCREAIEKTEGQVNKNSMVGTGPFQLESYQPGNRIVLRANPGYWGGRPKLDRIEMPVILNPETLYANFETGGIDVWTGPIPSARYAQDRERNRFSGEYRLLPVAQFDYLVMHPGRQPAFARKAVRRAFALAINRDEILKVAYKNIGSVADGALPPEMPGRGEMPPHIAYDPAKARQLLAQAGYPGGKGFPTLTLLTLQQTPNWQEACQIIRVNLRDNLGITVNLEEREASQYWDDSAHETMEFYLTGWIADYPDPQDFLSTLFASGSSLNHVKYHDPEFDALCAKADAEPDARKRSALYARANRILSDDVGVLPITFSPRITLFHKDVQGWRANLCSILPNTQTSKTGP